MADDRQQVRQRRTRRSRRQRDQQDQTRSDGQSDGQAYADSQQQLAELDDIITDLVSPSAGQDTVVMGDQDEQSVRPLTSEELVTSFRQQGGE